MSALSEHFLNLSELLLSEFEQARAAGKRAAGRDIAISRWLTPLLPGIFHVGPGLVIDKKDRQAGPFDVVGCSEAFPAFGDGEARFFLNDGVAFCLNVRDWRENDLTQFGESAAMLKKMDRKSAVPIFCAAVSFTPLPVEEVIEFLNSPAGQSVDGVLSIGHNVVLRNFQGWYGSPDKLPFVTERQSSPALKSFTFFLMHLAHASLGWPFDLADYQHL